MKSGIIKGTYNTNKYMYLVKYKLIVNYRPYHIEHHLPDF